MGNGTFTLSVKNLAIIILAVLLILFLGIKIFTHSPKKQSGEELIQNQINIMQKSSGIKLTLETAAMDNNVLILKYILEGAKLSGKIYTYQEMADKELELANASLYLAGWNTVKKYDNTTSSDILIERQAIRDRLIQAGLDQTNASKLESIASSAYLSYAKAMIDPEKNSLNDANLEIAKAVAEYENKLNNNSIFESVSYLSNIQMSAPIQRIEEQDDSYIVYNVYPIDTITDIGETFDLSINISLICGMKGKWNFNVNLNKANLNNAVETLIFNKKTEIQGEQPTDTVLVTVKKLTISNLLSVLEVQRDSITNVGYSYVVTDKNGTAIGGNGLTGEELIFTNRIILGKIDSNIRLLIYSNDTGELVETINLAVDIYRGSSKTNLSRVFTEDENINVKFSFPIEWEKANTRNTAEVRSSATVDGNYASFSVKKVEKIENQTQNEFINANFGGGSVEVQQTRVNNINAEKFTGKVSGNRKADIIRVQKGEYMYIITYTATNDTQYETHYEEFLAILGTVEFLETNQVNNIVYTIYETTRNNTSIRIPKININTREITKLNSEIEVKYVKYINVTESSSLYKDSVDYEYYVNNNILSLVITSSGGADSGNVYEVYNIDTLSGKVITNNMEILNAKGISKDAFEQNLKIIYANKYIELIGEEAEYNDEYKEGNNKTIASTNCNMNVPIYMDRNGDIKVIANVYNLGGSSSASYILAYYEGATLNQGENSDINSVDTSAYINNVEYLTTANTTITLPQIKLVSEEINKVNRDIVDKYNKATIDYGFGTKNSQLQTVEYSSYLNDNILSILIKWTWVANDIITYDAYNVDINERTELTNEGILKAFGINSEQFKERMKIVCGNKFTIKYGDSSKTTSSTSQYKQQYNATISDENCSINNNIIYVTSNGKLWACAKIYSLAGAEYYYEIVDTEFKR